MTIYWVRIDGGQYNIVGDKMFLDGDYLYIYRGEDLRAMFRADIVLEARVAKEAAP